MIWLIKFVTKICHRKLNLNCVNKFWYQFGRIYMMRSSCSFCFHPVFSVWANFCTWGIRNSDHFEPVWWCVMESNRGKEFVQLGQLTLTRFFQMEPNSGLGRAGEQELWWWGKEIYFMRVHFPMGILLVYIILLKVRYTHKFWCYPFPKYLLGKDCITGRDRVSHRWVYSEYSALFRCMSYVN